MRRLYRAAASRGVRVLLDGHGGDEVVSHGFGRLDELALAGHWLHLWREVTGVAEMFGNSAFRVFIPYLTRYGPRPPLSIARLGFRVLNLVRRKSNTARRCADLRYIDPEFASRSHLAERYDELRRVNTEQPPSERTAHALVLSSCQQSHAFEILDKASAAFGIELRYPFWDKRLVEFCLALPSEQKLSRGWSRLILRRAMDGLIPPEVQWRRDKFDFKPHIARGIVAHHRPLLDRILFEDSCRIGGYVDLVATRAAYQRLIEQRERADGTQVQVVWRAVVLALWLEKLRTDPSDLPLSGVN